MSFGADHFFRRRYAPAWLVLVLGLAASGGLGWKLHDSALQLDNQRLVRIAKLVHDYIEAREEKTEMLLRQGQNYFGMQEKLTQAMFTNWCNNYSIPRNQAWVRGLAFYTNINTGVWRSAFPADPTDWTPLDCREFRDWAVRTPVKLKSALLYSPRKEQNWPTNYLWEWRFLERTNRVYAQPVDCIGMNDTRTTGIQPVMIYGSNKVAYGAALVLPLYMPDRDELHSKLSANGPGIDNRAFNWNLCRGILVAPIDYKDIVSRIWDKYPQEAGIELFASKQPDSESWLNRHGGKPRAVNPTFRPYLSKTNLWRMHGNSWAVFVYSLQPFEKESPRRWAWVAGGAGVGLTLLASGLVGVALRARGKQEELTDQIREARDALAAAQEERDKFSRDLHDGATQSLYAIQLGLGHTAQKIENDPANARRELSAVRGELDTVIAEIRHFITAEASDARNADFGAVLRALVQASRVGTTTQIDAHCDPGAADRLSAAQAVQLANIAREALSNSLRHGKPQRVEIGLRSEPEAVVLEISDSGGGFDPKAPGRKGVGLASMAARAKELHGTIDIQSAAGLGTRVVVRVPEKVES